MDRPRHDLQKTPVERMWEAFPVGSPCAGWMHIIRIDASTHDGFELRKTVASFSPPGLVRRQVARNNVRKRSGRPRNQNEVSTAAQVCLRIDLRGFFTEVRVSTHGKFRWGTPRVPTIASAHPIDVLAS